MTTINVGEYGLNFNVNTNYSLTAATSLTMTFTRPDGTTFIATGAQITVPAVPLVDAIEVGGGKVTYAANQYASYPFVDGDLTLPGTYGVRLTYLDATKRLVSDPASFTVNP